MNIAIFGAQAMASSAYEAIRFLYQESEVSCFLVTSHAGNPTSLMGLLVRELSEVSVQLSDVQKDMWKVLIATPENVMDTIQDSLAEAGFHNIECLTSLKWAELMRNYYEKCGLFTTLSSLPKGERTADITLYMAKFYKDKALTSAYEIPPYICPVQVGAALCKERVAKLLDNSGDNISEKNVNYSELTALYWIWKNQLPGGADGYYGLVHYRRILELAEGDFCRLSANDIDVVLPYPMAHEPNLHVHHERYLKDVDYRAMLQALEELQPAYAKVFPEILAQRYMYNYNMILARRDVLKDYCEWLFPILERAEQLSEPKGWERADRYIGYMGETLCTLYFMANQDKMKIAHTGCRFLK